MSLLHTCEELVHGASLSYKEGEFNAAARRWLFYRASDVFRSQAESGKRDFDCLPPWRDSSQKERA